MARLLGMRVLRRFRQNAVYCQIVWIRRRVQNRAIGWPGSGNTSESRMPSRKAVCLRVGWPGRQSVAGSGRPPLCEWRPTLELRINEAGLQPGLMFFYANLAVLIENLWPHNVMTGFGAFPSDGKQLFLALSLSP